MASAQGSSISEIRSTRSKLALHVAGKLTIAETSDATGAARHDGSKVTRSEIHAAASPSEKNFFIFSNEEERRSRLVMSGRTNEK